MYNKLASPQDYGLPYECWRPHQGEIIAMLEEALAKYDNTSPADLEHGLTTIIEAPTGFGKSALPAAIGHTRPVVAVTITTDLQMQYAQFGFKVVYGKNRYPCVNNDYIAEWARKYGRRRNEHGIIEPSVGDCNVKACPVRMACPYETAKQTAARANKLVLNVHYAYYTNWWRQRSVRFFDEAHQLPATLASIGSFAVSRETLWRYGFEMPDAVGGAQWAIDALKRWAADALVNLDCSMYEDRRLLSCARFQVRLQRLRGVLNNVAQNEVYITTGNKLEVKMVRPLFAASRVLSKRSFRVLMSATIGDPAIVANELGIAEYEFKTVPHPFAIERRPVVFVEDMPALGSRSTEEDWAVIANAIATILIARPRDKGIVHVSSWRQAKALLRMLAKRGFGQRCFVPSSERAREIEEFRGSSKPLIAISPSWREGIDLPDDAARLSIIAKMPFPNLGDPIVKLRVRQNNGWPWYYWRTALGVVQAAGRVVRHAEDYGEAFILDRNWSRVKKYAPAWFVPITVKQTNLQRWLLKQTEVSAKLRETPARPVMETPRLDTKPNEPNFTEASSAEAMDLLYG